MNKHHRAGTLFLADPHLGHKNIHKLRKSVKSCEENTEKFIKEYRQRATKRTVCFWLGDIAFDEEHLNLIKDLPAQSHRLIIGNHDDLPTEKYTEVFECILGLHKWHEFWLSHQPSHPQEIYNRINVHGHVHYKTIPDPRYINICPEEIGQYTLSVEQLRWKASEHRRRCKAQGLQLDPLKHEIQNQS